jgi:hypothetical protein
VITVWVVGHGSHSSSVGCNNGKARPARSKVVYGYTIDIDCAHIQLVWLVVVDVTIKFKVIRVHQITELGRRTCTITFCGLVDSLSLRWACTQRATCMYNVGCGDVAIDKLRAWTISGYFEVVRVVISRCFGGLVNAQLGSAGYVDDWLLLDGDFCVSPECATLSLQVQFVHCCWENRGKGNHDCTCIKVAAVRLVARESIVAGKYLKADRALDVTKRQPR